MIGYAPLVLKEVTIFCDGSSLGNGKEARLPLRCSDMKDTGRLSVSFSAKRPISKLKSQQRQLDWNG